jgi:Holliday junction resolvase RusA-like endonuclease
MIKVDIKPLSVNEAWQGKRFKSKKYKFYEQKLLLLLPWQGKRFKSKKYKFYEQKLLLLLPNSRSFGENQKLEISIEWGFSNKLADLDNPAKCFIDVLQKKYRFNDCHIYKLNLTKEIVKKGEEYIKFEIKAMA